MRPLKLETFFPTTEPFRDSLSPLACELAGCKQETNAHAHRQTNAQIAKQTTHTHTQAHLHNATSEMPIDTLVDTDRHSEQKSDYKFPSAATELTSCFLSVELSRLAALLLSYFDLHLNSLPLD